MKRRKLPFGICSAALLALVLTHVAEGVDGREHRVFGEGDVGDVRGDRALLEEEDLVLLASGGFTDEGEEGLLLVARLGE